MYIFFYLHSRTEYSHPQCVYLLLLTLSNSILTSSRCVSSSTNLHARTQYSHPQGVYLLLLTLSNSILASSRCISSSTYTLKLNTHILKVYIFFYLHSQTQYSHPQGVYLLLLTLSNLIPTSSRCISSSTYTLKLNTHILKVYIFFYLHSQT